MSADASPPPIPPNAAWFLQLAGVAVESWKNNHDADYAMRAVMYFCYAEPHAGTDEHRQRIRDERDAFVSEVTTYYRQQASSLAHFVTISHERNTQ